MGASGKIGTYIGKPMKEYICIKCVGLNYKVKCEQSHQHQQKVKHRVNLILI